MTSAMNEVKDQIEVPSNKRIKQGKKIPKYIRNAIKKFGLTKPLVVPKKVTWEITSNCNLQCLHCDVDAAQFKTKDLTLTEIMNIAYQLKELGISKIAFTGGEPLTRPDFFTIANKVSRMGFEISLVTNGSLITSIVSKKLKKIGLKNVQVSLDGAKSSTHDRFRGVNHAFDRAIEGIEILVKNGFSVTVACTLHKDNRKEISDLVRLLFELKVQQLALSDLMPVGRGKLIQTQTLTNQEYSSLTGDIDPLRRQYKQINILWERVSPPQKLPSDAKRTIILSKCYACFTGCNITSDGMIQPCYLLRLNAGNLRKTKIAHIWKESQLFSHLRQRDLLEGGCGQCDYKYYCGGCRARAYAWFGNYMASDPRCPVNWANSPLQGDNNA